MPAIAKWSSSTGAVVTTKFAKRDFVILFQKIREIAQCSIQALHIP